jgi:phospholipid/cholesterol/gamma-HCH transport system substrate-binding protein
MKKFDVQFLVGVFIIVGVLCLGYLSIRLGDLDLFGENGYTVDAVFSDIGGLKINAEVVIAGVRVGSVKSIELDDYMARVTLQIREDVKLQEDAIVSVKTKGLIGEKFVEITPGGLDETLSNGDRLRETEPAVDLEELISKFVFGEV